MAANDWHFSPFSGSHPGSAEQMGADRRRDLGQDHLHGTQPEGGQSIRQDTGPHS